MDEPPIDETWDVAVVGGGPAGLGAAIALKRQGVARVVVLERDGEAGGIPRQCGHPPFGLREFGWVMRGPTYARRLRARALACGVEIRTQHSVTALLPGGTLALTCPDGPFHLAARRVVMATGAREQTRAGRLLSGTRPTGVINTATLQDCVYLKGIAPLRRPVIVGTELVALSAVLTCLRHGMRPVAVIEPAARAVARWPLGLFPRLFGIPVLTSTRLVQIEGRDQVEGVRVEGPAGTRHLACDGVVLSGQFLPESALVRASHLACDPFTRGPVVDQAGRCSDPAYFAAGNMLRPIETAGWCHREGLRTGHAVAQDLAGEAPAPLAVRVRPGAGVAWVLPQRLVLSQPGGLSLRADAPVRGRLTVRQGDRVLWSRAISTRPERRIAIPASALAGADADLVIGIDR